MHTVFPIGHAAILAPQRAPLQCERIICTQENSFPAHTPSPWETEPFPSGERPCRPGRLPYPDEAESPFCHREPGKRDARWKARLVRLNGYLPRRRARRGQ